MSSPSLSSSQPVSASVAARARWARFGDCAGALPGLEPGISTVSAQDVRMEWMGSLRDANAEAEAAAAARARTEMLAERFRARQEARKRADTESSSPPARSPMSARSPAVRSPTFSSSPGTLVGKAGKYVPPAKRAGGASPRGIMQRATDMNVVQKTKETPAIRIGNLTADADEHDVDELCRMFGAIRRIFISKVAARAGEAGFARVTFANEADAKHCIQRLNGHEYDHRALKVDWAN